MWNTTLSEHFQNTTLLEQFQNATLSEQFQNTTLLEQFQNAISKSVHLTHKYMTAQIPSLIQILLS